MEFDAACKQYEGQDLGDATFTDLELRGIRFVNCRFHGASMGGLITRDCAFLNCNFSFASLHGSMHYATLFQNCTFHGASLFSAEMEGCNCSGSSFAGANLTGFAIRGGNFSDTVFDGCDLRRMDLQGVCLAHAFFQGANLEKADLRGCDCSHAVFADAALKGADLRGARFNGVDVRQMRFQETKIDLEQAVRFARAVRFLRRMPCNWAKGYRCPRIKNFFVAFGEQIIQNGIDARGARTASSARFRRFGPFLDRKFGKIRHLVFVRLYIDTDPNM